MYTTAGEWRLRERSQHAFTMVIYWCSELCLKTHVCPNVSLALYFSGTMHFFPLTQCPQPAVSQMTSMVYSVFWRLCAPTVVWFTDVLLPSVHYEALCTCWPVLFSSLETNSGYYIISLSPDSTSAYDPLAHLDYLSQYSFVSYFEPSHAFLSEIVLICGSDAMLLSKRRHLVITLHCFHLGITFMVP